MNTVAVFSMALDTSTDRLKSVITHQSIRWQWLMVADSGSEHTGDKHTDAEIPEPEISNPTYLKHREWMKRAIALAHTAGQSGEVPVAAIVVGPDNQLIAQSTNRKERDNDPTAHAEVLALRAAGKRLGNWHLNECVLYVTLEPCAMCAGAIIQSRLGLLVYGADDIKAGAIRSVLNLPDSQCSNHKLPVIGGILEAPCRHQLQNWFRQRR